MSWRHKGRTTAALAVFWMALTAGAQEQPRGGPPNPQEQIDAMSRLSYMVGEWKGEGWIDFGGRRSQFRGGERVQSKLNGTALLVEGSFFARIGEAEVPVHTTLGVISYDPVQDVYRFHSWLATGTSGAHELKLTEGGWMWEIVTPRVHMRYTMTRNAEGAWFEIGERKTEDGGWQKFFEMTLRK